MFYRSEANWKDREKLIRYYGLIDPAIYYFDAILNSDEIDVETVVVHSVDPYRGRREPQKFNLHSISGILREKTLNNIHEIINTYYGITEYEIIGTIDKRRYSFEFSLKNNILSIDGLDKKTQHNNDMAQWVLSVKDGSHFKNPKYEHEVYEFSRVSLFTSEDGQFNHELSLVSHPDELFFALLNNKDLPVYGVKLETKNGEEWVSVEDFPYDILEEREDIEKLTFYSKGLSGIPVDFSFTPKDSILDAKSPVEFVPCPETHYLKSLYGKRGFRE